MGGRHFAGEPVIILAHGGTAGAIAETVSLAIPVVVFLCLSRWSKRKARALEAEGLDGVGPDRMRADGSDEGGPG